MDSHRPNTNDDGPRRPAPGARAAGEETCTRLMLDSLPWLSDWLQGLRRSELLEEEETQDLIQDICLDAWANRTLDRPDREAPGRSWLRRVACRLLAERTGRGSRSAKSPQPATAGPDPEHLTHTLEPVAELQGMELEACIESAIEGLPPSQRRVVESQLKEGLTVAQIAEREHRSENSVRLLKSRGLRRVRAFVERFAGHRPRDSS